MNIIKSFKSWYAAYGFGGLLAAFMGGFLLIIGAGVIIGIATGTLFQVTVLIGMLCALIMTFVQVLVMAIPFIFGALFLGLGIYSYIGSPRMEETDE